MPAPASDTQTAIDILKAENERLSGLVTTLTGERDTHRNALEPLTRERDSLKAQVGNPDEHRKRADDLQQKLRVMTHKEVFAKRARESGAREKAIDHLYQISGYVADKDDVDATAIDAAIAKLKVDADYAFSSAEEMVETRAVAGSIVPGTEQAARTPPAVGRGGGHDPSKSGIRLTKQQLADPKFMLDPRNKEVILAAAKASRVG
jgi:hypothetical protein